MTDPTPPTHGMPEEGSKNASAASNGSDITALTATALSRAIRRKEVSCAETLTAFLMQIDRLNPHVNALVAMQDRDALQMRARELDDLLARGEWLGPLHGFPQAPKDIAPAAGMVTTRGCTVFKGNVTQTDAVIFERMRRGGAVFVGRSNSPELGLGGHTYNNVYGTTRNAFDQSRSAGGSSGGAAVALALHMLPVADGSDMMGSLRTPAAFNNVFGLRTSLGCVPHGPAEEVFLQQFSVSGPMARNIPDMALLLSVQAGYDPRLPMSRKLDPDAFLAPLERNFKGCRVGWLGDLNGHLAYEPGILQVCEDAIGTLRDVGCEVEDAVPPFDFERLWQAWIDLRSFSVAGSNLALYEDPKKRSQLKPEAVWEMERGLKLSGQDIYAASSVRSAWYQTIRGLFDRYDFLLLPSAQVFPFDAARHWPDQVGDRKMDTYHRWMETTVYATMAGLPALSMPAGFGDNGLPAGLQLIGPPHADFDVLQLGHAYHQAGGCPSARSPLL